MNIKAFINEAVVRYDAPEPPFFETLKKISAWVAFIAGIPLLIQQAGIDITFLPTIVHQVLAIAGVVSLIISKLTASTEAKKELKLE